MGVPGHGKGPAERGHTALEDRAPFKMPGILRMSELEGNRSFHVMTK